MNLLICVLYLFCWIPILQRVGHLKNGSCWWNEGKVRTQASTEWKACFRFCLFLMFHLLLSNGPGAAWQRGGPHPGKAQVGMPKTSTSLGLGTNHLLSDLPKVSLGVFPSLLSAAGWWNPASGWVCGLRDRHQWGSQLSNCSPWGFQCIC